MIERKILENDLEILLGHGARVVSLLRIVKENLPPGIRMPFRPLEYPMIGFLRYVIDRFKEIESRATAAGLEDIAERAREGYQKYRSALDKLLD